MMAMHLESLMGFVKGKKLVHYLVQKIQMGLMKVLSLVGHS